MGRFARHGGLEQAAQIAMSEADRIAPWAGAAIMRSPDRAQVDPSVLTHIEGPFSAATTLRPAAQRPQPPTPQKGPEQDDGQSM